MRVWHPEHAPRRLLMRAKRNACKTSSLAQQNPWKFKVGDVVRVRSRHTIPKIWWGKKVKIIRTHFTVTTQGFHNYWYTAKDLQTGRVSKAFDSTNFERVTGGERNPWHSAGRYASSRQARRMAKSFAVESYPTRLVQAGKGTKVEYFTSDEDIPEPYTPEWFEWTGRIKKGESAPLMEQFGPEAITPAPARWGVGTAKARGKRERGLYRAMFPFESYPFTKGAGKRNPGRRSRGGAITYRKVKGGYVAYSGPYYTGVQKTKMQALRDLQKGINENLKRRAKGNPKYRRNTSIIKEALKYGIAKKLGIIQNPKRLHKPPTVCGLCGYQRGSHEYLIASGRVRKHKYKPGKSGKYKYVTGQYMVKEMGHFKRNPYLIHTERRGIMSTKLAKSPKTMHKLVTKHLPKAGSMVEVEKIRTDEYHRRRGFRGRPKWITNPRTYKQINGDIHNFLAMVNNAYAHGRIRDAERIYHKIGGMIWSLTPNEQRELGHEIRNELNFWEKKLGDIMEQNPKSQHPDRYKLELHDEALMWAKRLGASDPDRMIGITPEDWWYFIAGCESHAGFIRKKQLSKKNPYLVRGIRKGQFMEKPVRSPKTARRLLGKLGRKGQKIKITTKEYQRISGWGSHGPRVLKRWRPVGRIMLTPGTYKTPRQRKEKKSTAISPYVTYDPKHGIDKTPKSWAEASMGERWQNNPTRRDVISGLKQKSKSIHYDYGKLHVSGTGMVGRWGSNLMKYITPITLRNLNNLSRKSGISWKKIYIFLVQQGLPFGRRQYGRGGTLRTRMSILIEGRNRAGKVFQYFRKETRGVAAGQTLLYEEGMHPVQASRYHQHLKEQKGVSQKAQEEAAWAVKKYGKDARYMLAETHEGHEEWGEEATYGALKVLKQKYKLNPKLIGMAKKKTDAERIAHEYMKTTGRPAGLVFSPRQRMRFGAMYRHEHRPAMWEIHSFERGERILGVPGGMRKRRPLKVKGVGEWFWKTNPKYKKNPRAISLKQAKSLQYGQHIYHRTLRNADGSPMTFKVYGKPKTWKKQPNLVRISLKRGLYEHMHITESDLSQFSLTEGKRKAKKNPHTRTGLWHPKKGTKLAKRHMRQLRKKRYHRNIAPLVIAGAMSAAPGAIRHGKRIVKKLMKRRNPKRTYTRMAKGLRRQYLKPGERSLLKMLPRNNPGVWSGASRFFCKKCKKIITAGVHLKTRKYYCPICRSTNLLDYNQWQRVLEKQEGRRSRKQKREKSLRARALIKAEHHDRGKYMKLARRHGIHSVPGKQFLRLALDEGKHARKIRKLRKDKYIQNKRPSKARREELMTKIDKILGGKKVRPPKEWWAGKGKKRGMRKIIGRSPKYHGRSPATKAQITAGIWHGYPKDTQVKTIQKIILGKGGIPNPLTKQEQAEIKSTARGLHTLASTYSNQYLKGRFKGKAEGYNEIATAYGRSLDLGRMKKNPLGPTIRRIPKRIAPHVKRVARTRRPIVKGKYYFTPARGGVQIFKGKKASFVET
jgi:hypothetical protein